MTERNRSTCEPAPARVAGSHPSCYGEVANVAGNYYDKHASSNPIVKRLMTGFYGALHHMAGSGSGRSAFEVGCGEGYLMMSLVDQGWKVSGIDLDEAIIETANDAFRTRGYATTANVGSIYELAQGSLAAYDLVVCCEVLEHLPDPEAGLAALRTAGARRLVMSVPREPIWRALNMMRGRYLADLGNTPGHLNHWSSGGFVRLVSDHFDVVEVRRPLPWTFVHAKPR